MVKLHFNYISYKWATVQQPLVCKRLGRLKLRHWHPVGPIKMRQFDWVVTVGLREYGLNFDFLIYCYSPYFVCLHVYIKFNYCRAFSKMPVKLMILFFSICMTSVFTPLCIFLLASKKKNQWVYVHCFPLNF